jgi:pimeloyl-ACP methyl ester carboxylesterase
MTASTDLFADLPGGIRIAHRLDGPPAGRPLLLIPGLGMSLLGWHDEFIDALGARGYRVLRMDNRDIGASTHLRDAKPPDMMAVLRGDTSSASYTLDDMADDAAGLLAALGWGSAHVLGVSMGGMIAQQLAVRHPALVRSLTSVMSTTGEAAVSQPTPEAGAALFAPPAPDREAYADQAARTFKVIGSPGFAFDEQWVRARALLSYDRAYDPTGVGRQLLAVYASGDRTEGLRGITAPTLVFHGVADPLVRIGGGRATAAAIPGARLVEVDGMGHDLPREVWPRLLDALDEVTAAGEAVTERAAAG